ncbi:MAG: nucleotidyltransferase domain-containing protein [Pseudomonadota bacterium]
MSVAAFKPSIAHGMRALILEKLHVLETEHRIRILFAIESGSRAWGFPSPDSDYDVRFVYAREMDWYLSIAPGKDVIELPIEGDLDINGWDIQKALSLLIKPNPVLLEWLSSPVRYIWHEEICDALTDFADQVAHGPACLHHYRRLSARQWDVYIAGKSEVNLKKYFYVVRPAMAIKWIKHYPDKAPPMNFQALMQGIEPSEAFTNALEDLLIAKSQAKEVGKAPRIDVIDDFITQQLDWAAQAASNVKAVQPDLAIPANRLFRSIIKAELA